MLICDCPECPCWYPTWDGESLCFECISGRHNRLEDEVAA